MTVKDVLKTAILFIDKTELLALNTFMAGSQTAPTTEQQSDIDLLVKCFNLTYKEIASAYFPLLQKEKVFVQENKIFINNLSKTIINVKKISKNKHNLKYFIYPEYIFCETDEAEIIYSYLPDDFVIGDTVNLFGGRVILQVMAYGVAREFCYITGDYPAADLWESRFKDGLHVSVANKQLFDLPKRRFF